MRDQSARQKPMTATATRMVKAIWHAYFVRTGNRLPGDSLLAFPGLMSSDRIQEVVGLHARWRTSC